MSVYGGFASLYDGFMADVDRAGWADYILSLLGGCAADAVECACGTGEMTVALKRAGINVTGTDISQEMLMVASEKARKAGLNIPFVLQDMRRLSLHRPVDAVISVCDGVNYLLSRTALAEFFASAYSALKPGGQLLFDVSSRHKLSLLPSTVAEDGGEAAFIWRNEYDEATKLARMELTFFKRSEGGLYARFTETHIQRAHSERELRGALLRAGFKDIRVYGAFTLSAPGPEEERLQFIAAKEEK